MRKCVDGVHGGELGLIKRRYQGSKSREVVGCKSWVVWDYRVVMIAGPVLQRHLTSASDLTIKIEVKDEKEMGAEMAEDETERGLVSGYIAAG